MSKRKNKKQRQQAAIRAYYAKKSEQERARKPSPSPLSNEPTREKKLGYVYWANSQKIDESDAKSRRQYAVVKDTGKSVGVAKIRGYNNNSKNSSRIYELDMKKYPLSKRSGVDKKVYTRRGDNKKLLRLEDAEVFDKKSSFKLSSHDTHRVMEHANTLPKKKNNKGKKG